MDFDKEKLSELLTEKGVDENFFVDQLLEMALSKGMNKAVALRMIGELKGLGKKVENKEASMLEAFGVTTLSNNVQRNRRLSAGIEVAEFQELINGNT